MSAAAGAGGAGGADVAAGGGGGTEMRDAGIIESGGSGGMATDSAGTGSGTINGTLTFGGVTEAFDCTIAGQRGAVANYTVSANMAGISCANSSPGMVTAVSIGVPAMIGAHPQALTVSNNNVAVQKTTVTYRGTPLGADPANPIYTNTVITWDQATLHITGRSEGTLPHPTMPNMPATLQVTFEATLVAQ